MASKFGPYTVDSTFSRKGEILARVLDAQGQAVIVKENGAFATLECDRASANIIATALTQDDGIYLARVFALGGQFSAEGLALTAYAQRARAIAVAVEGWEADASLSAIVAEMDGLLAVALLL